MGTDSSVLVVEDEPDTLRGLKRTLGREGYRVEGARDGLEAMKMLTSEDFNVVVSDLKMPVMGGMELLRAVKRNGDHTVFVMITGYGTPEVAAEARKLGASDFIAKPFAVPDLLAAIERGIADERAEPAEPGAGTETPVWIARFHKEHAWASLEPDGTILVGADEEFFRDAGEVVFCDLPLPGDEVVEGRRCARTIDATGLVQTPFRCPVSGTVVQVNEAMEHDPWDARKAPYGDGWLFRIRPARPWELAGPLAR